MQLDANLLDISLIKPMSNIIRNALRENDDIVLELNNYLSTLVYDYHLGRHVFEGTYGHIQRNIVDTLTIIMMDHILYRIKDTGYSNLVKTLHRGNVLTDLYINLKHLEVLLGSDVAEVIEDLGEQSVLYKYLRLFLYDIKEHEVYKYDFISALCTVVVNIQTHSDIDINETMGSTITPDRLLIIFTRSNRHETYHVYGRDREGVPKPFGILHNSRRR